MDLAQPLIDDFVQDGNRHASYQRFKACVLVSINELPEEDNFAEKSGQTALWVGNIFGPTEADQTSSESLFEVFTDGVATPEVLEGAFTAAIYHAEHHALHLVNDKFGMRPLFVAEVKGHVCFCSEFEPLNLLSDLTTDKDAVAEYFSLGTTLGENTFREEIKNLAPASLRTYQAGTVTKKTYWQPEIEIDRTSDLAEHAMGIAEVMKTVVQSSLAQLTNPICLLSAGADSRLILSCMDKQMRSEMAYLTSNLSILAPDEDKDVIGALALAEELGLDQHQVTKMSFAELDFGADYFDRNRHLRAKKVIGGWHGGEYLGGFCSLAAPIREALSKEAVDLKMRAVLSRKFIRQLKQHPFDSCESMRSKIPAENRELLFQVLQMARGFFTNIYTGSRGHWLQPWQTVIHGYSPFWDSRFLQKLLTVPFEMLAKYELYNKIFEIALPELRHLPSNSPLTNRPDSQLKKMEAGTEPKIALQPKYQNALQAYIQDRATWKRRQYPRWGFKKGLEDGNAPSTIQFIDFEAWVRRFGK